MRVYTCFVTFFVLCRPPLGAFWIELPLVGAYRLTIPGWYLVLIVGIFGCILIVSSCSTQGIFIGGFNGVLTAPIPAHTHIRLTALFLGLPGWAGTRKAKPIWILLKQETVSGSGISWAICKSAPCCRQITTPAPHHSLFTGWMPFPPPNRQRQSTEGIPYLQ